MLCCENIICEIYGNKCWLNIIYFIHFINDTIYSFFYLKRYFIEYFHTMYVL